MVHSAICRPQNSATIDAQFQLRSVVAPLLGYEARASTKRNGHCACAESG